MSSKDTGAFLPSAIVLWSLAWKVRLYSGVLKNKEQKGRGRVLCRSCGCRACSKESTAEVTLWSVASNSRDCHLKLKLKLENLRACSFVM